MIGKGVRFNAEKKCGKDKFERYCWGLKLYEKSWEVSHNKDMGIQDELSQLRK